MPDVTLASTTDTPEQIAAALTPSVPAPAPKADAPAQSPVSPVSPAPDTASQDEEPGEPPEQSTGTMTDGKVDPPRVSPYQKRINTLVGKAAEAERVLAAERESRAKVEKEIEELRAMLATKPKADAPAAPTPEPVAPAPIEEPQPDQFDTYEAYIKAKVEHGARAIAQEEIKKLVEQASLAERERVSRESQERAELERRAQMQQSFEASKSKHADFDTVVNRDDIPLSIPMREAIINHPMGGEIAYYLGTHPDEAERISKLPIWVPTAGGGFSPTLLEMGQILARVEAASAPSGSAHAVPQSSAPPPIRPVGGRGASASTVPLDQTDYQTYKRLRDEATAGRRR